MSFEHVKKPEAVDQLVNARMSAAKLALLGRSMWKEQGWLRSAEPIAVVGMACRFPGGVTDPDSLWQLLLDARDVVTEVPRDRWNLDQWYNADPAIPGRIATSWGGFLDDIRGFDAAFFDISPSEAERMDPQQRIALEIACEAFEYAGIPLHSLRGTDTGVFFASYHNDYTLKQYADIENVSARTLSGTLHSVLANRISYVLGLHGPSLAIDSACSSSLVATHLACQALRTRDCDLAIAGGVNIMITPHITVALSKAGFMSPTGRCHAFDASADGFVRGEGCAAVVLKRLSDAIADGDYVLAVIRGSAVNQDGESTNLSAPNGLAQETLVRKALRNAGVSAEQVSFIEAHGTGTELGDPIETDALAEVFGGRSSDAAPCYLGSLKANLGHTEAAAGVAGLIKTVLSLRHRAIPAQPLFKQLNPHINLRGTPFRIATETTPWHSESARIAGVSSFGVGGTNAHVILEESPAGIARKVQSSAPPYVLPLAARSDQSLRRLAASYAALITQHDDVGLVARAAARRRTHYREFRAAPVAANADVLAALLERIAAGDAPVFEPGAEMPRLCFVYSGQGTQWAGMGVALMEEQPLFRASIESLDAAWQEIDGRSLIEELRRPANQSQLDRTDVAQVGIFAVQFALTELLASWGIGPAMVIGHSIGELAAACAAGMLSAGEALRAVSARGRVMQSTYDAGRMLAVRATEAEVQRRLDARVRLSIAAVNAPGSVVLSGATDQIERARALLQAEGIENKPLDVRFGFHSELMRDSARELRDALHDLQSTRAQIPLISTVTGRELERVDADYLARNIQSPVRFDVAVERALDLGVSHFIELGPHPALGQNIVETAESRGITAAIAFALHRERPASLTLRALAGHVFEWGVDPDWAAIDPGPCPPVRLPRYPWAHRPYWLPEPASSRVCEYDLSSFDHLRDHRIAGRALLPATALLELLRDTTGRAEVRDVAILRPIELEGRLQVVVDGDRVEAFASVRDQWELVAEARLASGDDHLAALAGPGADAHAISPEEFYRVMQGVGCNFGPAFRLLGEIRADSSAAWGALHGLSARAGSGGGGGWGSGDGAVAPAVVDNCAQLCNAVLERTERLSRAFLPWSVDRYVVRGSTDAAVAGRAVLREITADDACFDVDVLDDGGDVLVRIEGLRLRRTAPAHHDLRRIDWVPASLLPATPGVGRWLILHDSPSLAGRIATALEATGRSVCLQDEFEPGDGAWAGVVFVAGVDAGGSRGDSGNTDLTNGDHAVPALVEGACSRLLEVGQQLARSETRLLVVTRGSQCVGDPAARPLPVGGAVWGLARSIRAELPELRCSALDLDPSHSCDEGVAIAREALAGGDAEVAIRDGVRLVAQLDPGDLVAVDASVGDIELVHDAPGTLDAFVLRPAAAIAAAPDSVEVEVLAAGVNFRDVLTALGEYPGASAFGFEACGVVVPGRGAASVNGTAEGDGERESESVNGRVLVFWPGCFASRVSVPRSFVFPAPAGIDPVAAATIPVAFGTAWFALHRVGRVRAGMRVLVHSGAGGVGMAAIQLALRAGAVVYATAGTPAKRALLERMGVAAAFDSRSPSFEAGIAAATGGEGVEIVINSLTGPLIPAGLRCLSVGGVFVELGKREILDTPALQAIRDDVRYVAFDLLQEAEADPTLLTGIFSRLNPLFERGLLKPLPTHAVRMSEAANAFRRMARAEHVGKLVLVPDRSAALQRDGWYVVTGGLGELGRATAAWLRGRGATRIALVGRRVAGVDLRGVAVRGGGVEENGAGAAAEVRVIQADVSDFAQVTAALAELRRTAPIVGVIHAAAIVDDALLADITAERMRGVFAPKVAGAWNLHLATLDDPLELFMLYSAAGPVVNAAGLGSYAAANGFLDALAGYRRSRGLAGVSVLWGPWAGGGMAGRLTEAQQARWSRLGFDWWTPELAAPTLDRIAAGVPEQLLAVRLRRDTPAGEALSLRRREAPRRTAPSVNGTRKAARLSETILQLQPHRRAAALQEHVRAAVTAVLGRDKPVDVDVPLRDLGLDSLGAIELRNTLAVAIGESLPATLAFDYPTVSAIGVHLLELIASTQATATATTTQGSSAEGEEGRGSDSDGICVVGVGIRAPGGVTSLDEYARLLFDGVDAVGAVPPGRAYAFAGAEGGYLDSIDQFDPEFFGIAPLEAATIDPQQRLLLETVWEALEHAAIAPTSLRGSKAGVFVGIGSTDYHRMVMADPAGIDTYASTGTMFSVASGRIAYVLGLNGPAISIDTACSSSLVAVHLASQSLRNGESDIAIAAGVNLILAPDLTMNFRDAGMLSPGNRCRTFDAAADGYVRGEGCGVVVLKRLGDARRAGDRVLAVIRGSALNQDGRSSGLTAPSGPAQEAVIRAALADAKLQPDDIGYVEAHGTGTSLGDPIELQALGQVFGGRARPLLVGSVKTNVGHLESAAGIAGLIKPIVALQQREIPPHLHFDTPSPQIPWARLPVAIPTSRTTFEPNNGVRRAGVSSFGFSGTNAHVIVEEAPAWASHVDDAMRAVVDTHSQQTSNAAAIGERTVHLLTLSAPHEDALRALAMRYAQHLEHTRDSFADICYTANAGRAHFTHRIALVASHVRTAAQMLRTWLDGADAQRMHVGVVRPERAAIAFLFPGAIDHTCTLRQSSAVMRDVLHACAPLFEVATGTKLFDVLDAHSSTNRPELLIPARLAVQHALTELWRSWGIEPDVVAAEPLGELAAGVTAGIIDLGDAFTLAAAVGRGLRDGVGVGENVRAALGTMMLHAPAKRFLTASAPNASERGFTTPSFWAHVLGGHGRLADLGAQLEAEAARWLVAIGSPAGRLDLAHGGVLVGCTARGDAWPGLLNALAELYVAGANPDWAAVERGWAHRKVTLPTYPFQRRRFWYTDASADATAAVAAGGAPNSSARPTAGSESHIGDVADRDASHGAKAWTTAIEAAQQRAMLVPIDLDLGSYAGKWRVLQDLTEALGHNTLVRLGAFRDDAPFELDTLLHATGIEPLYRPIVRRWLDSLVRDGELKSVAGGWRQLGESPTTPVDLQPYWAAVDHTLADDPALLRYIHNAADRLEGVLTGRTSPLETLFPDGSFELAAELYESAGALRYVNGIAAAALRAWVEKRPGAVRVLEVGAGTGGTTSSLLRVLPADRTTYDYTDVSDAFLDFGREKFADVPFLRTRRFDLEADPVAQGIEPGGYDVLVASNVLHAMRDLPAALRRVRELLAPDGLLLLVESTGHHAWHDITTGLIEGWQHFADGRTDTPLLTPEDWRALLLSAGFDAVELSPGPESRAGVLKQHVILARAAEYAGRFATGDGDGEGDGFTGDVGGAGESVRTGPADWAGAVNGAIGREREERLIEIVRGCVMEVLRADPSRPPSREARLMDLGIDSLMAVRLRNLVQQRLGLRTKLPATLVFDYPTIHQIATLVLSLESAGSGAGRAGGDAPLPKRREGEAAGVARTREQEIAALSEAEAEVMLLQRLAVEEGV